MARTRCFYCDETIRESIDPNVPWVHTHSGNSYCDVRHPEDAVTRAGWPGRTEATPMRPGMFRARCQRDHELVMFDDREAFEAHMMGEHKARKPWPGMPLEPAGWSMRRETPVAAPGMRSGRILPPHEWKAPRPAPGGIERVAERIEAGEYEWPGWQWSGHRDKGTPAGEVVAA